MVNQVTGLGALVRQARETAGLTQGQLAIRTGYTQATICQLERRGDAIRLDVARKLIQAAGGRLGVAFLPPADPAGPEPELLPNGLQARFEWRINGSAALENNVGGH